MVIRKKKTTIAVFTVLLFAIYSFAGVRLSKNPDVKEGDVIFQTSKSDQAPLVALATGSKLTHCGIIVMKGNEPYVLEATATLRLTPLKKWIARGRGGTYWLKRPKNIESVKIKYKHLLGRSYDLAFSFNNKKYYCSELVYDIYKNQLGITLCEPRKIKSYHTLGMKKVMKRRGIDPEGYAVAPVDIYNSDKLQ